MHLGLAADATVDIMRNAEAAHLEQSMQSHMHQAEAFLTAQSARLSLYESLRVGF